MSGLPTNPLEVARGYIAGAMQATDPDEALYFCALAQSRLDAAEKEHAQCAALVAARRAEAYRIARHGGAK